MPAGPFFQETCRFQPVLRDRHSVRPLLADPERTIAPLFVALDHVSLYDSKKIPGGIGLLMLQRTSGSRCAFALSILLLVLPFLFPFNAEAARRQSLHAGKDVKGITFEEFWARTQEEATKWAGSHFRVRRVISIPVVRFDGRSGRSPVWEAQIVRCDRAQSVDETESVTKSCKGRSITVRMVEAGVTGTAAGVNVSKERHFRGFSVPVERVVISPQRAEETANNHRQYRPAEIDGYAYELKYDPAQGHPCLGHQESLRIQRQVRRALSIGRLLDRQGRMRNQGTNLK